MILKNNHKLEGTNTVIIKIECTSILLVTNTLTFFASLDPCSPNPCASGGQCSVEGDRFNCKCAVGFKGDTCKQKGELHTTKALLTLSSPRGGGGGRNPPPKGFFSSYFSKNLEFKAQITRVFLKFYRQSF